LKTKAYTWIMSLVLIYTRELIDTKSSSVLPFICCSVIACCSSCRCKV